MTLFDAGDRTPRWSGGSRALVAIEAGTCPVDGATLVDERQQQAALFRHGGYGATAEKTVGSCPQCGWTLVRQTQEVKP